MNISIILYLLIFALGLGFSFYHVTGYLKTKVALLCAMFYMSSAIIFSFDSYMGWPTDQKNAPDSMIMLNVIIFDKTTKSDGVIYVTGIPCATANDVAECMSPIKNESFLTTLNPMKIFGYGPPSINTPRVFEFPYTEHNREIFASAQEVMHEGGQSFFRRGKQTPGKEGDGTGSGQGEADGEGMGKTGEGTQNADSEGAQEIYVDNKSLRDIMKKDQAQ